MPFTLLLAAALTWIPVKSPTQASLRGLAVVSAKVVWASGTQGTWLLTQDGGAHWQTGRVEGGEKLDFRDIAAWDARRALLLASGEGQASRLYETTDGGAHWTLVFRNTDDKGFFDAMAFWDRRHGVLLGDPVDGNFLIFTTSDGGHSWQRQQTPPARPGEGAFAASGTCLAVYGRGLAWFGTGGARQARVFRSTDGGRSWAAIETPLEAQTASAGIFSLEFSDAEHGIAVGGNYKLRNEQRGTLARTKDGGQSWQVGAGLGGYRSAVAFDGHHKVVVVGTGGADLSGNNGQSWQPMRIREGMNAVAARGGRVWAVGARGTIARMDTDR